MLKKYKVTFITTVHSTSVKNIHGKSLQEVEEKAQKMIDKCEVPDDIDFDSANFIVDFIVEEENDDK